MSFFSRPAWIVFFISFQIIAIQCIAQPPVAKTNTTDANVDGTIVTRSVNYSTADFPVGATVGDVNVNIQWVATSDPCPNLSQFAIHGENGFWLISPSGTKRVMIYDAYNMHGRGNSISNTYDGFNSISADVTFDDAAATQVGGDDPVSGTFRPEEAFTFYNGETPFGNWTLYIADQSGFSTICFQEFTVTIAMAGATCTDPDVPTISGNDTICPAGTAVLSVAGSNLNSATQWNW